MTTATVPSTIEINAAVRAACRVVRLNAPDEKVAKALEILGVPAEEARNHGLAHFRSRSIGKSVRRFFER